MMADWKLCKLGDFIHVKHGYAFKGKFFASEGEEIVLTPGNFKIGGGLQFRSGKEKYYSADYPAEFRLDAGDLLIVMTDLKQDAPILGSAARVPPAPTVLHNQRLGLVRVDSPEHLDERFLYHLLNDDSSRRQLRATATGTTVRHTAPNRIYEVQFALPPIGEQRAIASILDSLDEFIENNRRRIEILEEMAQALYREWFVNFRFPGHETATFVDSPLGPIPEDWRVESIARVCKRIQSGGTPKRSESSYWLEGTVDWYKTGDLTDSILLGSSERISSVAVEDGGVRIFEPETILMAIYGSPTVGRLGLVREASSANQAALGLVANDDVVSTVFLWFSLRQQRDYFNQIAQGAAQQNISKKKVADALILVPAPTIVSDFSLAAESTWRLSHELARQNTALESARDLLLPKLVSGEIDVSDLDLDAVLEGAV